MSFYRLKIDKVVRVTSILKSTTDRPPLKYQVESVLGSTYIHGSPPVSRHQLGRRYYTARKDAQLAKAGSPKRSCFLITRSPTGEVVPKRARVLKSPLP
jgi:hypothetical protein